MAIPDLLTLRRVACEWELRCQLSLRNDILSLVEVLVSKEFRIVEAFWSLRFEAEGLLPVNPKPSSGFGRV